MQGLAAGLGSSDLVSSPTFTLSKIYKGSGGEIHHYDFYRLNDPGILTEQLVESLNSKTAVTVVEWGDSVEEVLPTERIIFEFKPIKDNVEIREINIKYTNNYVTTIKLIETKWNESLP